MQQYILLGFFATAVVASVASGGEVGFAEDFALAKDRTAALKQLIPGTEDYYYYHALHYLNTEQFAQAEAQLKPWIERFGHTARVTEIQTRHALLVYDADSQRTLKYIREHLNLHFNHQKEDAGGAPNPAQPVLRCQRIASPVAEQWPGRGRQPGAQQSQNVGELVGGEEDQSADGDAAEPAADAGGFQPCGWFKSGSEDG